MGYIERKSLKWVNDYRVTHGAEPLTRLPRGRRKDPNGCVVQRALGDLHPYNSVSLNEISLEDGSRWPRKIRMPWYMSFMILTFDMGLRRKQDERLHGHDNIRELTTTYSKDVLSLRERFAMWREKQRVAREMAQEQAAQLAQQQAELAKQQAERLRLKQQWDAHYEKVWAEEFEQPVDEPETTPVVLHDPDVITQIAERRDEFLEVV